jgi:membrane protease YdiL (CAAX protease family)
MRAKVLAIIEVSIIFSLSIFLFRFVNSTPLALKVIEFYDGLLFPGYAAVLIVAIYLYIFRVHIQPQSHFPHKLKYQINIIAYGFFSFFILSVLLSWIDWKQWTGAVLISIVEIGLLFWFAWTVKDKPDWQNAGVIGSLFISLTTFQISPRLGSVTVAILYYYFFVALSEEVLFRGYILSRLNSVFGHPHLLFRIHWGWGLIVSSILFGFWHLGWKLDMLKWQHVLWTTFAGLLLGVVREKSKSVIAPTILHGIMNYGPQAILFYLFWSQ